LCLFLAGLFTFLVMRRGVWALAALLSAPAFLTVSLVQWSAWMACAAMVPWFGWAFACKPNAGLPVVTAYSSARSLVTGLAAATALVVLAFVLRPAWVGDWLAAIRGQPHFRPYVLRPGGFLLLLALLRWRRPEARWLATLARHPLHAVRAHVPYRWAERTVILLVMQARDNALRIRWNGRRLRSEPGDGEPAPTWIPEANEAARHAADVMGGLPGSGLNEVLLSRPFTAHILGGAAIGATRDDGVIDAWHRVWTEPGLHVVDGSAVSANLGANPALTIAAQAERAMSFWPARGEPDERPPLGSRYADVRASLRSESTREQPRQTTRSSS
jgi:choline dehydrogenase-like flavoprotein